METHGTLPPSADDQARFRMIDVGGKEITRRRAVAQGRILVPKAALLRIRAGMMPKGDVLAMAEVAGIQAAKKTAELLPLCHPLPLDSVRVWCEIDLGGESILVQCEARAMARTGVEMEALCGVHGALLAIYDLTKGVEPALRIGDIRLRVKEGGKRGSWRHPLEADAASRHREHPADAALGALSGLRAAVIVVSDRCSRGEAEDRSGAALADALANRGVFVIRKEIVPDEKERIQRTVRLFALEEKADLVVLTGGTGIGPRDVTPDALEGLWARRMPGIGELLRSSGAAENTMSWLSRADAGIIGSSLVVLLPGSVNGAVSGFAAIEKALPHAIHIMRGGAH